MPTTRALASNSRSCTTRRKPPVDASRRSRASPSYLSIDFLVSWNCTHIASGRVRRILESVNRELRIRMAEICTPYELIEDEDDA